MEPTGIEPVTSCLQSSFADDLQEARKTANAGKEAHRRGYRGYRRYRSISADLGTGAQTNECVSRWQNGLREGLSRGTEKCANIGRRKVHHCAG